MHLLPLARWLRRCRSLVFLLPALGASAVRPRWRPHNRHHSRQASLRGRGRRRPCELLLRNARRARRHCRFLLCVAKLVFLFYLVVSCWQPLTRGSLSVPLFLSRSEFCGLLHKSYFSYNVFDEGSLPAGSPVLSAAGSNRSLGVDPRVFRDAVSRKLGSLRYKLNSVCLSRQKPVL